MRWFGLGRGLGSGVGRAGARREVAQGDGIVLRTPAMADHPAWSRLRAQSRAFLSPWEPIWPADDLTAASFRRRLRRYRAEADNDQARHFLIFKQDSGALLGGLTLGEIRRGVTQTATLGYWMGAPHAGKGYMTRAVRAAALYGFEQLRLHRIEAACVVANAASARLLIKNGFQREGRARAYLKINGVWHDHELFALLDTDTLPPLPR